MNSSSQATGDVSVVDPSPEVVGAMGSPEDELAGGESESAFSFLQGQGDLGWDEGIPLDVVYDILKNERRRYVLLYLQQHEDTVTIGELAESIAAFENDIPVGQLNAQQRKRVYIGLYQCHLPKMADADVIDFEKSRGEVSLGPYGADLLRFLKRSISEEVDRTRYYYAVVGTGALVFVAGLLVAPSVAWVPHLAALVLTLGVLGLTYFQRQAGRRPV